MTVARWSAPPIRGQRPYDHLSQYAGLVTHIFVMDWPWSAQQTDRAPRPWSLLQLLVTCHQLTSKEFS